MKRVHGWAILLAMLLGVSRLGMCAAEPNKLGGEIFDNEKLLEMIDAGASLKVILVKIDSSTTRFNGDTKNLILVLQSCKKATWTQTDVDALQVRVMKECDKTKADTKAAVDRFLNVCLNWDSGDYDAAMRELMRLGQGTVPFLLQHWQEENPLKRKGVLDALGKLGDKSDEVTKSVVLMLNDREPGVRAQAAQTTANLAGANTLEDVIEKLRLRQYDNSDGLVMTLGYMKNPKAIPVLLDSLTHSENRDERLSAAWALGNMRVKDEASQQALLNAILDPKDERLRVAAAKAAGECGDSRAVSYISKAFARYKEGRADLIDQLKYHKKLAAVDICIETLDAEDNQELRKAAADTLKKITGENYDTSEEWKQWREINRDRPDWIETKKPTP